MTIHSHRSNDEPGGAMTRIYLLRHGATAANLAIPYRLQGKGSDLALDGLGIEQARRAAEALSALKLSAVYTSPMLRAVETARLIARSHRLEPIEEPALSEADVGRWEGLTWEEARARDPEWYSRFQEHPGTVPYPGGESFLDVATRVSPALVRMAANHPQGRVAVVGHNVVNRAYLALVLGLAMDRARSLRQSNGGINVIHYEAGGARLMTLNAALHLEGIETAGAAPSPH
jgi:broad specificity phosphatase PhoE